MSKLKLLTSLNAITLLLSACASDGVDEVRARDVLTHILSTQESTSFILPTKGSVLIKHNSAAMNVYHGHTISESLRTNTLLALDLSSYYYHSLLIDEYDTSQNIEMFMFVKDGVFYKAKKDNTKAIYHTTSNLTGQEITNILINQAKEDGFYDYLLGRAYIHEGFDLLDIYDNGADVYRDSKQVGTIVDTFNFSFLSSGDDNLEIDSTIETRLDYIEEDNHGLFYEYDYRQISLNNDILNTYNSVSKVDRNYYFQDTLISSYTYELTLDVSAYNTLDLFIPTLDQYQKVEYLIF